MGIRINPAGIMEVVGGAYPYVGGDITSGLLISRIYEREELSLLIDIGTNGEIVLGNKEWMVCCSASAGPAFEGSGVKHGMRAVAGGIQGVWINGEKVKVETIDNQIPLGICGSGYIDIISELYKNGITDRSGVIVGENKRVREGEEGKEFIVVPKEESGTGEDIVITQVDIENLIRAKAAIFAALSILIKKSGVEWEDISKVYVAGGFGTYLNIKKAISIGLLPDFPVEKFEFLDNASLLGCQAYLLSEKARDITKKIVSMLTYIELSTEPEYMEEYLKALFLPHTDLNLFPSLKND
ncbi:DUF4445 domain-containing protein [bacterium]|nr:DUF4445 domain-containing protein [bacterium]